MYTLQSKSSSSKLMFCQPVVDLPHVHPGQPVDEGRHVDAPPRDVRVVDAEVGTRPRANPGSPGKG